MKTKKEEPDRVWFEFDKPVDAMHANEICVKANRMLARLSMTGSAPSQRFEWDETRKAYCYGSGTQESGVIRACPIPTRGISGHRRRDSHRVPRPSTAMATIQ